MKYIKTFFLTGFVSVMSCTGYAQQKHIFDVASYFIPKGWQQKQNDGSVQLLATDNKTGIYAMAIITKATPSDMSASENFNTKWKTTITDQIQLDEALTMQPASSGNGWEIETGGAAFTDNGVKGKIALLSATGGGRTVSVVIIYNSNQYDEALSEFLNSLELSKIPGNAPGNLPAPASANRVQSPDANNINIAGTWINRSSSNGPGTSGYIENEYIFNTDGTYSFYSKLWSQSVSNLILKKEKGTFIVSGKQITVVPATSVTEGWSKKNGIDEFGKLLSSTKNSLEKTTYQFTKFYFEGIKEWNLVLQADKPTKRDGPFSSNTSFSNAWYYAQPSAIKPKIQLPE